MPDSQQDKSLNFMKLRNRNFNWNENVVFVVVECEFGIEYSNIDHSHGPSKTFSIAFT